MSDFANPPLDTEAIELAAQESSDAIVPALPELAPHGAAVQVAAVQPEPAANLDALLEILRRGLSSEADAASRTAAREVSGQLLQLLGGPPPVAVPTIAIAPAAPIARAAAAPSAIRPAPVLGTPQSPFAATIAALRQMPAEQILDLALQRLRAVLPTGMPINEPRGIQFTMLPATEGQR